MAHIPFPRVPYVSVSCRQETPGQFGPHRSIVTGTQQVISRGFATWSGSCVFGPYRNNEDAAREVMGFLANVGGMEHTFDVPLHYDRVDQQHRFPHADGDPALAVADYRNSGTRAELQLSLSADPLAGTGLLMGDMVTLRQRLHVCVAHQVGDLVTVSPSVIDADVGDEVEFVEPYVRARGTTGEGPLVTVNYDFMERVSLLWVATDG